MAKIQLLEDKVKIYEAYANGTTVKELAKKWNVSESTIYNVLKDEEVLDLRRFQSDQMTLGIKQAYIDSSKHLYNAICNVAKALGDEEVLKNNKLSTVANALSLTIKSQTMVLDSETKAEQVRILAEAEANRKNTNSGLILAFTEVLKGASNGDNDSDLSEVWTEDEEEQAESMQ